MIKISIIIPCHYHYIKYLDICFEGILNQTKIPYEVILVISQTLDKHKNWIFEKFNKKFLDKNIKFKIINFLNIQYAGINRNIGALNAVGDLLVFIDADDIIHPMKIEITEYLYNKYNFDGMLHSYVLKENKNFFTNHSINYKSEEYEIYNKDDLFKITFPNNSRDRNGELKYGSKRVINSPINLSLGYMTVKKEIFNKIQYTNLEKGQDAVFFRDCLWNDYNIMAFNIPLFIYDPQ